MRCLFGSLETDHVLSGLLQRDIVLGQYAKWEV